MDASPSNWEKMYSEKYKRDYWKNKTTGETTWKEPKAAAVTAAAATSVDAAAVATSNEWEKMYSEKYKRDYWKNKTTGETTWKEPKAAAVTAAAATSVDAATTSQGSLGEWTKVYSAEHQRDYWFNPATSQTTWDYPTAATAPAQSTIRLLAHIKAGADACDAWVRCVVELRGSGSDCVLCVYNILLIEQESLLESSADIKITVDQLAAVVCNERVGELELQRRATLSQLEGAQRSRGRGSLSLKSATNLSIYLIRFAL